MNLKLSLVAFAIVTGAALPAMAGQPPAPTVVCSDSAAMLANPGYVSCTGWHSGNANGTAEIPQLNLDYPGFSYVGKSDDAFNGPFTGTSGATSGTLIFDSPMTGSFVIALKGGPDYSFYLYNVGNTPVASFNFDTNGIVTGGGNPGPGLSHAALYVGAVPEPETYALLLAGLAAVGFVARRRRA